MGSVYAHCENCDHPLSAPTLGDFIVTYIRCPACSQRGYGLCDELIKEAFDELEERIQQTLGVDK